MHLTALEERLAERAICDKSGGYNHIYHPVKWIVAYFTLDAETAALLPGPGQNDDALKRALHRRVDAQRYRHVRDGHTPEIALYFQLHEDHPFHKATHQEVALVIIGRLKRAIEEIRRAKA